MKNEECGPWQKCLFLEEVLHCTNKNPGLPLLEMVFELAQQQTVLVPGK
jgi:hypothetical protein